MKIICTKNEFASFIRECQGKQGYGACQNCALNYLCGEDLPEEAIEFVIQEDADAE